KFTSLSPYRFQISGRTKHYINTFGEELLVDNADHALQIACRATDAIIRDYTAGPVYFKGGKGGAPEWSVELQKERGDLQAFCDTLDKTLREINSDYDAKRFRDLALTFPIIHQAEKDTFYRWMKSRGKLGGQNKVPRLANERTYLDALLKIMNT